METDRFEVTEKFTSGLATRTDGAPLYGVTTNLTLKVTHTALTFSNRRVVLFFGHPFRGGHVSVLRMYRDLHHRTSCCVCLPYRRTRSIDSKGHPVYRSVADTHDAICERVLGAPLPPAGSVAPRPVATTTTAAPPPSRGESTNGIDRSGERTNHGQCLALRDFYPFWRENLESAEAGKVLPVDLSDSPKVSPKLPGCRYLSSLRHSRDCSGDYGGFFFLFRAAWLVLWPVAVTLEPKGALKRSNFLNFAS